MSLTREEAFGARSDASSMIPYQGKRLDIATVSAYERRRKEIEQWRKELGLRAEPTRPFLLPEPRNCAEAAHDLALACSALVQVASGVCRAAQDVEVAVARSAKLVEQIERKQKRIAERDAAQVIRLDGLENF